MPKRTNETQQLVHRLERLLHGHNAEVVESAMVRNSRSGSDEELDVLITFNLGGRDYRTAISVRHRGRDKGGPGWIRDLAKQRDQCGIDRIVAAHTRGFTPAAAKIAKDDNVELVTIADVTDDKLLSAIEPLIGMEAFLTLSNTFAFRLSADPDSTAEYRLTSAIGTRTPRTVSKNADIFITINDNLGASDGRKISMKQVNSILKTILQDALGEGERTSPQETEVVQLTVPYVMELSNKCVLIRKNQPEIEVHSIIGIATVAAIRATFDQTKRFNYRERKITVNSSKSEDRQAHLTVIEGAPIPLDVIGDFSITAPVKTAKHKGLVLRISDLFVNS